MFILISKMRIGFQGFFEQTLIFHYLMISVNWMVKHISMRTAQKEENRRLMKVLFLSDPKLSNQTRLYNTAGTMIKHSRLKTSETTLDGLFTIMKWKKSWSVMFEFGVSIFKAATSMILHQVFTRVLMSDPVIIISLKVIMTFTDHLFAKYQSNCLFQISKT